MIKWLQVAVIILSCKQTMMDNQIKEVDGEGLYLNSILLEKVTVEQRDASSVVAVNFKLHALGTLATPFTERLAFHYVIFSLLDDASTCVLRNVYLGTEHRIDKTKDCAGNLQNFISACVADNAGKFTVDDKEGYFMCEFPVGNETIRIPSYCFSQNTCYQQPSVQVQSESLNVDLGALKEKLTTCQNQTDEDDIVINGEYFYCKCTDTSKLDCDNEDRYYFFR